MDITETYVMLVAADMDRAVAFWRDSVGLRVRFASPHWSELVADRTVIAVHGGGSGQVTETGLGFRVRDVHAACERVAAGGGQVVKGPEERPDEGIVLADCLDPDGNTFMLSGPLG